MIDQRARRVTILAASDGVLLGTDTLGIIYGLIDPRDGLLRYVGQTRIGAAERLKGHLCESRRTPKCRWVKELAAFGLRPSIIVLVECPLDDLDLEEVAMIASIRMTGALLLNVAHGNGIRAVGNSPVGAASNRARQAKDDGTPVVTEKLEYWERWPEDGPLPPPTEEEIAEYPEEMRDELRSYGSGKTDLYYAGELARIAKYEASKRAYKRRQKQRLLEQYRARCAAA